MKYWTESVKDRDYWTNILKVALNLRIEEAIELVCQKGDSWGQLVLLLDNLRVKL